MYDAIIVGARCAGASTALLLARHGYRVLLLDRATFPSDTISTHIIWPRGAAQLGRWGLLDRLLATGCPPITRTSIDFGPFTLTGSIPPVDGVTISLAPRRTVLDQLLIDAAIEAGAEFRQHCAVHDVLRDGERVTGVQLRASDGRTLDEHARIVIGADGRTSFIARAVAAQEYHARPTLACWYYSYWSGIPTDGIEMISRPPYAASVIPTHDGLVNIPVACQAAMLPEFRQDIERSYHHVIGLVPHLAERVRQGRREERMYGMVELPNVFRTSYGASWALVGDAGYHKDPITAQGISDAFAAAELLATAVHFGLSGRADMTQSLARYQQLRDEHAMPMFELTCDWASLEDAPPEMQAFFFELQGNQPQIDRFFGAMAGSIPIEEYFGPENIERVLSATP